MAGRELTVSLPPRPACLNADPARLTQVFKLKSHAIEHTDRGGRIEIRAEIEGDEIVVS